MSSRITQNKLDKLWEHLTKLQEQVGRPLLKEARGAPYLCPIYNFAPDEDRDGRPFHDAALDTFYTNPHGSLLVFTIYPSVYHRDCTDWWENLPDDCRKWVTEWVEKKIAETNAGNDY